MTKIATKTNVPTYTLTPELASLEGNSLRGWKTRLEELGQFLDMNSPGRR